MALAPCRTDLVVSVELATELERFTHFADSLLGHLSDDLSDLGCTCSDLEFVVNPRHVAEVTGRAIVLVPAVVKPMFFHEDSFDFDDPLLADDCASGLEQEVQRRVRRADVNLATIQTTQPTALPLDVETAGRLVPLLLGDELVGNRTLQPPPTKEPTSSSPAP
ncbi:hypothetical protein [Pseudomonas phage phiPstE]|nr:hypothetical protein [Pseudomonas phage phiPstE]